MQLLKLKNKSSSKESSQAKGNSPENSNVNPKVIALEEKVLAALKTIFDPEIPVNIYDLGLIYGLTVTEEGAVTIQMTLTSPTCPVAESLPGLVQDTVLKLASPPQVLVDLVWDPPWTQERMSDAAKLQLNLL